LNEGYENELTRIAELILNASMLIDRRTRLSAHPNKRFNFLLKPGVNRICISALLVSKLSTSVPSGKVAIMSNFQINAASNP
jgi:hypothetical protein